MSVSVTPHLNFRGEARAALEFYRDALDGELTLATYGQLGGVEDPAEADLIVFGQVTAANGFRIMAFDMPAARPFHPGDSAFFVSARGDDPTELTALFERLGVGGTVVQPIGPSVWSPLYGMLVDRFAITWVLDLQG